MHQAIRETSIEANKLEVMRVSYKLTEFKLKKDS